MEWGCGNRKRSRQLYKQGMQCAMAQVKQQKRQQMKTQQQQRQSPPRRRQPFLGCLLTSWGSSEAEIGNSKTGMQLLRTAVDADPFNAQAWLMWARWVEDRGTITAVRVRVRLLVGRCAQLSCQKLVAGTSVAPAREFKATVATCAM